MDIELRLNKDMLVLSGDCSSDIESTILEQDTEKIAYKPYIDCGVQCIVANTKYCLKSVLAHNNLENKLEEIAKTSLELVNSLQPQHTIVELGPTGLPLDGASKNSLIENKNQYVDSARVFENYKNKFDAYLLSGMQEISQIKCALMGLRQVSDKPIMVVSAFNDNGDLNSHENIYDYCSALVEFGATIAGFKQTSEFKKICKRIRAACDLPILAEYEIQDEHPDLMKEFCADMHESGAQFLRASGNARPAHAALLVAMSEKLGVKWKSLY